MGNLKTAMKKRPVTGAGSIPNGMDYWETPKDPGVTAEVCLLWVSPGTPLDSSRSSV